jgi:hypothetical protein
MSLTHTLYVAAELEGLEEAREESAQRAFLEDEYIKQLKFEQVTSLCPDSWVYIQVNIYICVYKRAFLEDEYIKQLKFEQVASLSRGKTYPKLILEIFTAKVHQVTASPRILYHETRLQRTVAFQSKGRPVKGSSSII